MLRIMSASLLLDGAVEKNLIPREASLDVREPLCGEFSIFIMISLFLLSNGNSLGFLLAPFHHASQSVGASLLLIASLGPPTPGALFALVIHSSGLWCRHAIRTKSQDSWW